MNSPYWIVVPVLALVTIAFSLGMRIGLQQSIKMRAELVETMRLLNINTAANERAAETIKNQTMMIEALTGRKPTKEETY